MTMSLKFNFDWDAVDHARPLALLMIGMVIGSQSSFSASSSSESSSTTSLVSLFLTRLDQSLENLLIPLYAILVIAYLTVLAFPKQLQPVWDFVISLFRGKQNDAAASDGEEGQVRAVVAASADAVRAKEEQAVAADELVTEEDEPQPIDMSGAYKLISNDNFDGFLAVQGVSWALRNAANQARPTHRIAHRGRKITIKIEGIIETQTTYFINGPPVETNVRGRIFEDVVQYLENGKGILVSKRALTEEYDVTVQRELSDDRQEITMTSTAYFRDGRDPVKCMQIFRRCE